MIPQEWGGQKVTVTSTFDYQNLITQSQNQRLCQIKRNPVSVTSATAVTDIEPQHNIPAAGILLSPLLPFQAVNLSCQKTRTHEPTQINSFPCQSDCSLACLDLHVGSVWTPLKLAFDMSRKRLQT